MQWAQRQRLQFIEHRLYWEGRVNRGDIAEAFGVSVVQASHDLRAYRDQFPDNAVYDTSNKGYLPSPHFTPGLIKPSPDHMLRTLTETGTVAEIMPLPERTIDPEILRPVLRAVTERIPLHITYQSLSRPFPLARTILPHTFISDTRWHVRGFCAVAGDFRDFLLARILGAEADETAQGLQGPDADVFWNRKVPVELAPHPGLTAEQQAVVARDYAMTNGKVVMTLRQAYLPYFLRRLNLVEATDRAQEQQLMIRNRQDVDLWHREVMPAKGRGE